MFQDNPEYPISFWINELVEIISKVEGIPKKDARLRKDECLGDYIKYYEAGLKPQNAVDALWMQMQKPVPKEEHERIEKIIAEILNKESV